MEINCYKIKTFEADFNPEMLECAGINNYAWTAGYSPAAFAQLAVISSFKGIKEKQLWLRLTCMEADPKAVYRNFYEPVYEDSCLEFFFTFENLKSYVNCEMNSAGAALIAVGENRNLRRRIDEITVPPTVKAIKSQTEWSVETCFSQRMLSKIFGTEISLEKGTVIRGNFYKCGDETVIPHYGMWNKVISEAPDFHRPEFFGRMIIE